MSNATDIAIVGAGPYGLSIAAHLRSAGARFRIFGTPMHTWYAQMPDGMLLKSDGFASNLSDPAAKFTLERFCRASGIPYDHTLIPVALETFRSYGLAFQRHMVPNLEDTQVARIDRSGDRFTLCLDTGKTFSAHRVVIAVGISHFAHVPPVFQHLRARHASHSSAHTNLGVFNGRRVLVVGGGASAIDSAALLREHGADVSLLARRPLRFNDLPAAHRTLLNRLQFPSSPIGPGWKSRLYSDAPWLFRYLPERVRTQILDAYSGSAAGWPMKPRFAGKLPTLIGYEVERAEVRDGEVRLQLRHDTDTTEYATDHVLAATGYRVDLRRLAFLGEQLLGSIKSVRYAPVLCGHFESSVPGLFFVGPASAPSFGPVMRFACGAEWTARRIAARLAGSESRRRVTVPVGVVPQRST